ncbi:FCD domain-containing protein [Streptomyces luomodiensis]|uniref:FCD domain-containing protein n=1 Tax=Streptomyces luomodiensis TaxID=3026192 RepID=A0ABY9URR8_9ACTN|nr:FCD domain-containing protein [Streptomyces sp. SCA4-21]WNE95240.1 FCD domain-containing protein [Streptomyces sp. SCA4-21]
MVKPRLVQELARLGSSEGQGDRLRLPTERELVERLDISRGALREQLSMLEALGFLDRTQGRGSYLRVPDATFVQLYFDLSEQLGHLRQDQFRSAREMLELSLAEAAARRADADDVDRLRALVDEMVAATADGDDAHALEADLEFHRTLCLIVDNPVFNLLHEALGHVLRSDVELRRLAVVRTPLALGETRITDTVHYEIVDALHARDGSAAREAMRRHFTVFSAVTGEVRPPSGP